jgi:hypothetical protein
MSEHGLINPNDDFTRNIVFSKNEPITFEERNISDAKITGEMSRIHKLGKANIISSHIDALHAKNASFNNSDIKDSRFTDSIFENCDFNHASNNNNWIKNTQYSNCTFNQTAFTISDFTNCNFTRCDFTNVIISDCRFINCSFVSCITSNKMIESSLLFDCYFKSMEIELETISSNFGLSSSNLIDSHIRIVSPDKKQITVKPPHEIVSGILEYENNNIQKFKLQYFLAPTLLTDGTEVVDNLFRIEDWLKLCRNPNRFKLHIEKLHEFLLYQFDANNLRLRTLMQLFDVSSQLSDAISKRSHLIDLQRTVDGIFITLERMLELYFTIAKAILGKAEEDSLFRLLVVGPLEKDFYLSELFDLLNLAPIILGKIIKHNSPNELFIHWEDIKDLWPIILFVFSTKCKFELNKLDEELLQSRSRDKQIQRGNQILKLESGFLEKSDTFSFRLRTLLSGYRELSLVIQISPERYKKLMRIIKDVIVFDKKKKENLS